VDRHPHFFQDLEHADVRNAPRAAAGKRESDAGAFAVAAGGPLPPPARDTTPPAA